MQAQFNKLVKWIKTPPQLKLSKPFIKGRPIKPLDNNRILYQIQSQSIKKQVAIPISESYEVSPDNKLFEDMCHMNVLNQPQVLNNLLERYKRDLIFTYIGPTLIVMNPYKYLGELFGKEHMAKIRAQIIDANLQKDEPHAYMIAGKAYLHMKTSRTKQAIVISGQSGAGKTQSTKYCMKILTSLSHPTNTINQNDHHSVQEKILSCNPLLQAFGNSKTVRNDNSSRFGKYVQMYFGQDNAIKGASIHSYLLQKSRVVSIANGERSFHAFYALVASKKFGVRQAGEYAFLKQSGCYTAAGINDQEYFRQINQAMESIEFQAAEQQKIWQLLKAILELGNIQFSDKPQQSNQQNPCQITNKQYLKPISQILQTSPETLQKILVFQKKVMVGQVMFKAYKKDGCVGHRNTLCKAIYNAVFQFILQKIQVKLRPKHIKELKSINILDIFGFQNFEFNSFEQLCINFTNQKLLKLYNQYIFKRQMQLLLQDGLQQDIKSIKPPTNDVIINMINGPGVSIFSITNDNTTQQQCTDKNIKSSIQDRLGQMGLMEFSHKNQALFTIKHSQCAVEYSVEGFKMKNLDKVNEEVGDLIGKIKMFKGKDKEKVEKQAGRTLLKKFGAEIQELIKELASSNVNFVRCIKPNQVKKANYPIQSYVLSQVRYLGVFQTIQIRKKTFPVRKQYPEFVNEYKMLFQNLPSNQKNNKHLTHLIISQLKCQSSQFMMGHKRVYINERIEGLLNKMVYEYFKKRNEQIKRVQEVCRRFVFRSKVTRKVKRVVAVSRISKATKGVVGKVKGMFLKEVWAVLAKNMVRVREELKKKKEHEEMIKKQGNEGNKLIPVSSTSPSKTSKPPQISKQRLKQLQQINQKFFKYTRPIAKAFIKLSLAPYFSKLKQLSHTSKKSPSKVSASSTLNETILVEPPPSNPSIFKLKNSVPKPQTVPQGKINQEYKFNESFYNEQSVYISPGAEVIFTGNLKIPMFQNSKANRERLTLLQNILGEKHKSFSPNQSQVCSPHSQDSTYRLEETPQDIMNKVINFPIEEFFIKTLRKRTGVFGMKKDYTEILVYKPRPLTKTLTQLTTQEEHQALKVFKLLLKIGEETMLDNVFKLVDNVMRYCQQTTSAFKNQVFLQLLKQANNQNQVPAIRIYQTLSVYLHIYTPDDQFLYAALHLFFNKISQKQYHQKQQEFLRYLYKKILRKIQKPHGVGYMPIKYQIMALMSKRQISIPIYLPIGSNILVKAESYETFADIKKKVMDDFGINRERIPPAFFAFFEVVNYENTELEENPVNENSVVWDVMTYWELAKEKYQESGVPPPYFSIMVKIKYPFECTYDDEQAIELYFAQCYFDYSMGRIRLELKQMSMLAACIKKIKLPNQANDNIEGCFPLWMNKLHDQQTFKRYILDNLAWLEDNHLDQLAIKYKFLQVCSQSPLALTFAIPTDHSLKLFMKPKRIYLVQKGNVIGEYSIREIAKWSNNHESFNFEIRRKDGTLQNKTHMILTDYSHLCTEYLNKVSEFLIKYGGRNKSTSDNKVLKGI